MCDFETDFCDWTNLNDDEFDWQRDRGGTGSGNTGPSNDHTTKSSNGKVYELNLIPFFFFALHIVYTTTLYNNFKI